MLFLTLRLLQSTELYVIWISSAVSNRNVNIAVEYTGMKFISVSYKGSLAVDGLGLL